jgi:hypothetical protein
VNAESYDRLGALVTTISRATEGMPTFYYQGKLKRGGALPTLEKKEEVEA